MFLFMIKAILSGILFAAISTVAKRYPGWGGLIASLPLVSVLSMIWLYGETRDAESVARLSLGAFWFSCRRSRCSSSSPRCFVGAGFRSDHGRRLRHDDILYAGMSWLAPRVGSPYEPARRGRPLVGGLDSMVCAALAREAGFGVLALTIDYGSGTGWSWRRRGRSRRNSPIATSCSRSTDGVWRIGADQRHRSAQGRAKQPHSGDLCPCAQHGILEFGAGLREAAGARDLFIGANALDYPAIPIAARRSSRNSRSSRSWRPRRAMRARRFGFMRR